MEHDEDTIFSSDYIVGYRAGCRRAWREIVVADYLEPLLTAKKDNTKSLLLFLFARRNKDCGSRKTAQEAKRRAPIRGGGIFNIQNLNVDMPLGRLTLITGVSGSGKSSFLYEHSLRKSARAVLIAAIVRTRCSTARRFARSQNTSLARFPSSTITDDDTVHRLTPPHTPAHSRLFAIYLHPRKRRAYADGKRIAFRSTLPAGGVKHAKETAKSRLRCTFCRRCMLSVMSAAAKAV